MATTKTLNTRIQLKYDSYQDWYAKNPILLAGELAIATIEAADNQAQNPPTVLFKVGPGEFNSLDWVSAKAADVHAWAKLSWEDFVAKILPEIPVVDDLTVDQLVGAAKTATYGEKISIVTAVAKGEGAHNLDVTTTEITLPAAQDVSNLVSAEATDDDVVVLSASASGNKVTINGAHAKVGANATKGATADVTISGYDATGSIKVPKAIVDEYGHVTGLTEQTLSITMPSEQVITHPEYSVVKDENAGDYAAVYHLTKDGVNVGAAINIPKDLVVKSGSVDANGNIVLILNDENETEITIEASSLIEYVTSGSQAGDMVFITVDADHKVTATITDGTVTKAKLASDVQTSLGKADTALQPAALNDYYTKDEAASAFMDSTETDSAIDAKIAALDLANTYQAKGEYYTKDEANAVFMDSTETDGAIDAKIAALKLGETYQPVGNYKTTQAVVPEKGASNQTIKISQNENGVITTEAIDIQIAQNQVTGLVSALANKANDGDLKAIAKTGNVNDLIQGENDVLVLNCGTAELVF